MTFARTCSPRYARRSGPQTLTFDPWCVIYYSFSQQNICFILLLEFLLGENILVAPVTREGAENRDIYLPKGIWRDENYPRAKPIQGPILLQNYKADLYVLPYFTRLDCDTCSSSTLTPKFVFE